MLVSGEKVKSMYEQMMDEHDSEGRSHELESVWQHEHAENCCGCEWFAQVLLNPVVPQNQSQ